MCNISLLIAYLLIDQACRLASLGLSGARLGTLLGRGFGSSGTAAAELFHDQTPFELARWPNIKQKITGTGMSHHVTPYKHGRRSAAELFHD